MPLAIQISKVNHFVNLQQRKNNHVFTSLGQLYLIKSFPYQAATNMCPIKEIFVLKRIAYSYEYLKSFIASG